jgi:mRNA interferase RelE/StbE
MEYKVIYRKRYEKKLKKIDKKQRDLIIAWIEKNLEKTKNPRKSGKALKGSLNSYWRYRIGSYRIIAEIQDKYIKIILN